MIRSRRMRWAGHVKCMVKECIKILVEKTERNGRLKRTKHMWEANMKNESLMYWMMCGLNSISTSDMEPAVD
jgi:hypothetical protein